MKPTRTIKVVLIASGCIKGYTYSQYLVVECNDNQRGYLSERGVRLVWRSENLYRPFTKSGRGKGPEAKAEANQIRERELLAVLGV